MSKNRFGALSPVHRISEGEKQLKNAAASSPEKDAKPVGKRNRPNYRQVTAYVPRDVYQQVTLKLAASDPKGEFSELVENLLREWIKKTA